MIPTIDKDINHARLERHRWLMNNPIKRRITRFQAKWDSQYSIKTTIVFGIERLASRYLLIGYPFQYPK